VSGEEVLMKPMLIVMRHVPVGALLAGAVVLAGLALALPVLGDVDGLPHVTCVGFLERSLSDSWSAD
jgi:hypothetical protein